MNYTSSNKLPHPSILLRSLANRTSWLAAIAALFLISASADAQTLFGRNLIVNGDAESDRGSDGYQLVRPSSWEVGGKATVANYGASHFPKREPAGENIQRLNFFSGGPSTNYAELRQNLVVSDLANRIDSGAIVCKISGLFGGWTHQNDNATLVARLKNDSGLVLKTISVGGVNAPDRQSQTTLLNRETEAQIPPGTRLVEISVEFRHTAGNYNDGYADNLSFVLKDNGRAQPDAQIGESLTRLLGDGVYSASGRDQFHPSFLFKRRSKTVFCLIQNDGGVAGDFLVRGPRTNRKLRWVMTGPGGANLTAEIGRGTVFPDLAPESETLIRGRVRAQRNYAHRFFRARGKFSIQSTTSVLADVAMVKIRHQ